MKRPSPKRLPAVLAARSVVRKTKAAKHLTTRERDLVAKALVGEVSASHPAMESPLVQEAIIEALGDLKIDNKYVAQKIKDGLEAMETKFFAKDGEVMDERSVINWGARHQYLTTLLEVAKIKGDGSKPAGPGVVHLHYKSRLKAEPRTIDVTSPTSEKAQRRLIAAKPTNRKNG